jgi:hypothetical protein
MHVDAAHLLRSGLQTQQGPRQDQGQGVGGLPVHPDLAEHMSEFDQDDLFAFTVGRLLEASLHRRS